MSPGDVSSTKEHIKELETFLNEFDYFTAKSKIERQKLKFHQDYNKSRVIYHDDVVLVPSSASNRSSKIEPKVAESVSKEDDEYKLAF